jgi:LAS superfamily LD-carboxypeptidase LdcB
MKHNVRTTPMDLTRLAPTKNKDTVFKNTTFPQSIGSNSLSPGDLGAPKSGTSGSLNTRESLSKNLNGRLNINNPNQLTSIGEGHYLNPYVAEQLSKMKAAAAAQGINLRVVSSYRDYSKQASLYANRAANRYPVAEPGKSNHGLGLAVDIDIRSDPKTLNWLFLNGGKYGFKTLYDKNGKPNDKIHWEIRSSEIPHSFVPTANNYLPNNKFTPKTTNSSGNLDKMIEKGIEYNKTKTSPDVVKEQTDFFNNLDTELKGSEYDNYYTYGWFKSFNGQVVGDVKSNVGLVNDGGLDTNWMSLDSFLFPPSDSFATLSNRNYNESVMPIFDLAGQYGPTQLVPPQLESKMPPDLHKSAQEFNNKSLQKLKENIHKIFYNNEDTDASADPTTPHGLNLVSDIKTYNTQVSNQSEVVKSALEQFPNTGVSTNFYSTMNNKPAYNPRDLKKANLQKMDDIYYSINVEGTVQLVDILQKKYRHSMSTLTIDRFLCVDACSDNKENLDSNYINERFLYQVREFKIKTPISYTEAATSKIETAVAALQAPVQELSKLDALIQNTGITAIPGLERLSSPLQGAAAPLLELSQSINSLPSLVTSPINNLPSVLPSVDPGSFPQIYSLISGLDYKNPSIGSVVQSAQELKNIICDFKLPVIGEFKFDEIFDIDDFDLDKIGDKLESLIPKIFRKDGFKKFLEDLVPDFKEIWKDFYKTWFECNNKKD